MRRTNKILAILLMTILFSSLSGCAPKAKSISDSKPLLGTDLTITVFDKDQTKESLQPAFKGAFGMIQDIETRILRPGPENELDILAANAGDKSMPLSSSIFDLVMDALKLYDETHQVFDIRIKPMLDAYGFGANLRVPTDAELDTLKKLVSEGGMFVAGKSVLLAKPGMGFTLYKIGPGFALDQAAVDLTIKGVQSAVIKAGRIIRLKGDSSDPKGFPVEIKDPLNPEKSIGTAYLPSGGFAIVACDEGAFEKDGKKYHMLLDPRTGKPASLCTAFAVYAESAAKAQALALSAFILGPTDGLKLLESFKNASGLAFYEKDGQTLRFGSVLFECFSTQ